MARPKMQRTKYEILQCATKLFLEKGYTDAYVSVIARTLQISTGNLTFWFPTKEHILAELVSELFEFQWKSEEQEQEQDLLLAICSSF
ncbi:MAG: TetR/AcrR family transcriptional regulator [Ruminococcus sp.]|nr:TetR/AcrR family transcriptional regulator [Ruminococcus sp.]